MSFHESFLEWSLVQEQKECDGEEVVKGRMDSIDQCVEACNGVSSMFAFGTNDFGENRCYSNGCECICETAARDNGICYMNDHKGYRLYKFGQLGK